MGVDGDRHVIQAAADIKRIDLDGPDGLLQLGHQLDDGSIAGVADGERERYTDWLGIGAGIIVLLGKLVIRASYAGDFKVVIGQDFFDTGGQRREVIGSGRASRIILELEPSLSPVPSLLPPMMLVEARIESSCKLWPDYCSY